MRVNDRIPRIKLTVTNDSITEQRLSNGLPLQHSGANTAKLALFSESVHITGSISSSCGGRTVV